MDKIFRKALIGVINYQKLVSKIQLSKKIRIKIMQYISRVPITSMYENRNKKNLNHNIFSDSQLSLSTLIG